MLPVGLGFLFCESLAEAVFVLVGAAMDEKMKDGGGSTGGRTVIHRDLYTFRVCDVEEYEVRYDYT